ncbi:MAG: DsbA family protein [Candidatus Aenigmatarchaeota archaeon]
MSESETPQEKVEQTAAEEKPRDFSPGHDSAEKKRKVPFKQVTGFAAVAVLFFAIGFLLPKGAPVTGQVIQNGIDKNSVANSVLELINMNLKLNGINENASIVSVEEESGLYKITLSVQGKETPFYATKDGKYFVQAYEISDIKEQLAAAQKEQEPEETPKTDKPNVKMFVMSYCPFGEQAENGLGPALEAIGLDNVEFEPHFVIYSNYAGGGSNYCFDNESKYCSMHGINELREDIRQMVIWKYWPEKWWAYVNKVNAETSTSNIEDKWKDIANSVGLNATEIQDKFDKEAMELLKAELELNEKMGVRGSPTIFINGVQYKGSRSADAFKTGICNAFTNPPSGCGQTLNTTASTTSGSCG